GAGEPAPRPSGRRGDDLHVPVELSFVQAVTGLAADLPVDRLSPGDGGRASRAAGGSAPGNRRYCRGLGPGWSGGGGPRPGRCAAWEGSGAVASEPCSGCRGRGVRTARAQISVALPPGLDTGGQVRVAGEGHSGPFGGPRGDVVVVARVHDDP